MSPDPGNWRDLYQSAVDAQEAHDLERYRRFRKLSALVDEATRRADAARRLDFELRRGLDA